MIYRGSILNFFTQTYGVGKSLGTQMCYAIDVAPFKPAKKIAEFKRDKGFNFLKKKNYETGFILKNIQLNTLIYYSQIKNIKSFKLKCFLPINGQRNKTNGRTAKRQAQVFRNIIKQRAKKRAKKSKLPYSKKTSKKKPKNKKNIKKKNIKKK